MTNEVTLSLPTKVTKNHWILNNGNVFPKITFGITQIEGFRNVYNAVNLALAKGFRSFDCSPQLDGEINLGTALEELLPLHNLERKDIIISSKILPKDYGTRGVQEAFLRSCANLKTDYIDLFLMQWPGGYHIEPESTQNRSVREETWKEIIRLNSQGVVKSAGVCHFNNRHLESIRKLQIPAVNQVEFHPRCPQVELLEYCSEHHIQLQAASYKETFNPMLLIDSAVKEVAESVKRTPTQVLLKWILNNGVGVIPQSQKPIRIEQSLKLFDFSLGKPKMVSISSVCIRERYLKNSFAVV